MRLLLLIAALAMLPMLPALAEESFDYSRYGYETIRSRVHFGKNASIGTINQGVVSLTFSKGNYSGSGDDNAIFQWNGGNLVVSVKSGYRIRWIILRDTEGGNRKNLNRVGSVSGDYKYDFDENSITNSGIAGKGVEKLNDDENNITIEDYNAPASSVTITDNTDTGNQLKARDIIVGYVLEKSGFEKANYGIKPNESVNLNFTSDHDVVPTFSTDNDGVSLSNGSKSGVTATGVSLDTTTVTASWTANATYAKGSTSAKVYVLPDYLCFTAEKAGSTISFNKQGNGGYGNVQISFDQLTWRDFTRDTKLTLDSVGNKVYFRGNYRGAYNGYTLFVMTGKIAASGNIMTLTDGNNPTTSLKGKGYVFYNLFMSCSALTSAPALPATTLAESCYNGMFNRCTALRSAPTLPATTLADYCYTSMFDGCTSLTAAPALPATTLTSSCYFRMFSGCTALTSAPALPATKLADRCYYGMFQNCTKLNSIKVAFTDWNSASDATYNWVEGVSSTGTFICLEGLAKEFGTSRIPAGWTVRLPENLCFTAEEAGSTISFNAYGKGGTGNVQTSFNGIIWSDYERGTKITLKDVGDKVYFRGDYRGTDYFEYSKFVMTGKIAASGNVMTLTDGDNPTTSLKNKNYAFYRLFEYCTALTSAPELPATTLANYCYNGMFYKCAALTSAPALPATTLANYCYNCMFIGCTALTSAPALPATTLAKGCYYHMFDGCTALTSAPELPATTLAESCYYGMFYDCTSLTIAPALPATELATGCYCYMFKNCKKLNSIKAAFTDWNSTSYWVENVSSTGTFICPAKLAKEFSKDRIPEGWTVQELPDYLCFTAEKAGSTISFNAYKNGGSGNVQISIDGFTWRDYTRGTTITLENVGDKVYFKGNYRGTDWNSNSIFTMTGKIAASGNIMTLTDGDNPTTSLKGKSFVFYDLFNYCTALTSAPELPATTLADHCYDDMFSYCTSLKSAPELPATTLASYCYYDMFQGCSALTSAPELPATKLADYCYESMFYGCTKLNYIKVAFTDWDAATNATSDWVEGVSSTGTFDCPVELKKQYGTSYIPRGWYRQLDGSGTSNDPYKITSADDLIGLSGHNELWDKYFIQTNDIDFGFSSDAKSYFMPIGTSEKPFTGHYDGQQHIISNLTVNHPELSSAGLFGYIGKGATVKNLMVQGSVQGKTYAGIIAGVNEGELTSIAAFGTVQHTVGESSYLGGMIGKNAGGIHSSYAVVDIIHGDDDTCGGLVGQNEDGTYDNCYYDKQICPLSENWGIAFTTKQLTAEDFAKKNLGSGYFMPSHYPWFDTNDELEQFATLAIILHSDENVVDNIHQVTHDFNVTPMEYCYWHGDNDNISIDEDGAVKLIKNGAITLYADFENNNDIIARKTIKLQIAAKPKIEELTQTVFKHGDILTTPAITLYEEIDNAEGGWEISFTGENEDYHALENNELFEEHNGCYLRFWAKNSIGTSYSNVICITVTSSYTLPCSYRFSTFSSNLATDFSGSGLTPYYVCDKNEDRTTVTLAPFENGIVPAGQGAVLYNADIIDGTSENFTVKVTAAAGTTPAVNYLKPALTAIDFPSATTAEEADYKYMLGDEDKWWWINGGTLAANKAYLDLSSNPSAAKSFIMCFDEETTAISSSSNEKLGISNSADAYNLAGQRVSKDYKGIVIKNGKKFKN